MKVAIVGIGAMGSLFAGRLIEHTPLLMVGQWQPQLQALRRHGLALWHSDGRQTHHRPTVVAAQDAGERKVDVALILVKSYQTAQASRTAQQLLGRTGIAVSLQNGLGNQETLVEALGPARTLVGATSEGAVLVEPGIVRHAGDGITQLARGLHEQTALVKELFALFRSAGFATGLTSDVDGMIWGTLALNAAIHPLTALLRVRNGVLATHTAARQLMQVAAAEVAAVAQAQGIALPYISAPQRALEVAQATASHHSAMLQDVHNSRTTEIEAMTGAVVRLGKQYKVPTPVNEVLLRLVTADLTTGDWRSELAHLPSGLDILFNRLRDEVTV